MSRLINVSTNYDLLKPFGTRFRNFYDKNGELYAWWRFDVDISSSGDLPDLSGNGRDLGPGDRPAFAENISPATTDSPTGFSRSSAYFDREYIEADSASTFSFGDGTNDSPFSMACWIKLDDYSPASSDIMCKDSNLSAGMEYVLRIDADSDGVDGQVQIILYNSDTGGVTPPPAVVYSSVRLQTDSWYHVAASYNGNAAAAAGTSNDNGLKLYVDGVDVTDASTYSTHASYVAMNSTSTEFTIGNTAEDYTSTDFNGWISSAAVWSAKLSAQNIKALYDARYSVFRYASGILNNPPRILLQNQDNHTGSYPTIARTGNTDFTGKYFTYFDDTDTLIFSSTTVAYPTSLPPDSKFVSGGVATPNILGSITGPGDVSPGVSDAHISFTPGENISAFNESRVYIDNDSHFYLTGTASGSLPGFSQKLSSKTILSFESTVSENTSIVFSTGTDGVALKPQAFVLAFKTGMNSSYVPAGAADTYSITISVSGSADGPEIPGVSTSGSNPTSTYAFVFKYDHVTWGGEGGIPDPTDRQKIVIDITNASGIPEIAQTFVTGVNESNAPFTATYALYPHFFGNYFGDEPIPSDVTGIGNWVCIRNINPGKPLLETNANTKITYSNPPSYANGGPVVSDFNTSTVLSGTLIMKGADQTIYSDNDAGLAAGINSGIAYYNWQDSRWEVMGDLTAGRNVDFCNSENHIVSASMLATVPAQYYDTSFTAFSLHSLNTVVGMPSDAAGFPLAPKFNATGSQHLFMSSSISSPYLVEKISLEWSGSVPATFFEDTDGQATNVSFMVLLEREGIFPEKAESSINTTTTLTSYIRTSVNERVTFPQTKDRRIIWVGRYGCYDETEFSSKSELESQFPDIYRGAELWIPRHPTRDPTTGSFRIEAPCKTLGKMPLASAFLQTREAQMIWKTLGIYEGGRSLSDMSDGRSFVAGVVGSPVSGTFQPNFDYGSGGILKAPPVYTVYNDTTRISPFVLLPTDKLILMCTNQDFPKWSSADEAIARLANVTELLKGKLKLTMFGSLLRDNLPIDSEFNQSLTSDALHEDVHYDIPVQDQWDVEPDGCFAGSYVDSIITGSMLATPIGDSTAANVRQVVASVAAGGAGITGSLQRFVRLTDWESKMYDSYPPDFSRVLNSIGGGFGGNISSNVWVALTSPSDPNLPLNGALSDWYLRFAYDKVSTRFDSKFVATNKVNSYDLFTNELYGKKKINKNVTIAVLSGSGYVSPTFDYWFTVNKDGNEEIKTAIKTLWGVGSQPYNAPSFEAYDTRNVVPHIRGYKYGLAGIYGSAVDARFRRDRFGQFRDMLEQRRFPATLKNNSVEYPISINFVPQDGVGSVAPSKTHSQNLSPYATSSLPYFDGLVRERSDNPDLTLAPIDIDFEVSIS